ncbi:glycosyl transferase [Companilactobacillus sp. RD055328]|uniref:glycosyltransferase family 2 protein n=1 Tax=Companilactobacillus sp. RD055328 TaxID=2916634 RepID=UPI001FC85984|nr:glycosyltransferase family A protein [Companilactobacillus sp. RD055328]GKQ43152.1 glycosyl transferase [Companilactobacillus sp. RD055328]
MTDVSIIIPVYNSEKTIARAIDSCQNQTFKNIEIIVVDNLSTDNTNELVKEMAKKDSRIKLISLNKKGRSLARNAGMDQANGKYIQFLDADDTLEKNKIEYSVIALKSYPTMQAYGMAVAYVKNNSQKVVVPKLTYSNELLTHNIFPINTFVFRKTKIRFDEQLDYDEDWLFWVDLFEENSTWQISSEIGCQVYVTGENTMSDIPKMIYYEVLVRSIIKRKYPKWSIATIKSDFKKVIMVDLLEQRNDISPKDAIVIYNQFRLQRLISKLLMIIPPIRKKIKYKFNNILEKSFY